MYRLVHIVAALLLGAASGAAADGSVTGRVTAVPDGDTISVQTMDSRRIRIRIQGIDAPERTQPYSQISRRNLHELVHGKTVTFDPEKLDRHGRTVAVVRLQDRRDVGLEQIRAGLSWHFKRFELEQTPEDRSAYAAAEIIARAARLGLWRDADPLAPWDFRARNRMEEVTP